MKKQNFTCLASGTKYKDAGVHLPFAFIQRHFVPSGDHLELHFESLASNLSKWRLYPDYW